MDCALFFVHGTTRKPVWVNGDIDASEIEVDVRNGEVTLSRTGSSREAKRAAGETAQRCSGVKELRNRTKVQDNAMSESGGSHGTSSPRCTSTGGASGPGSSGHGGGATTGSGLESGTDTSDGKTRSRTDVGSAN